MTVKQISNTILLFALAFTSCQSEKASLKESVQLENEAFKQVEQIVQGVFDDVWSAKKIDAISKYQTTDFVLLEHGEIWTNDTIANWCKRAAIRSKGVTRINRFDFFKAKKEGNRIWMVYHNYATFKSEKGERKGQWLESIVAVKKDSLWKLEMMHSTRIPRQQKN